MDALYHAYQAYEHQVQMGVFSSRRSHSARNQPDWYARLLAGAGELLLQVGSELKKQSSAHRTISGAPVLGKLNR